MSSFIGVYGKSWEDREWMRSSYSGADELFQERHPIYESEHGRFEHGILERESPKNSEPELTYYWTIYCHWDSGDHFRQTERDIRSVLEELEAPKGLEICLSPHVS